MKNDSIKEYMSLRKPCGNCPFKKEGGVKLPDDRSTEIFHSLMLHKSFDCHKTVHNPDHERKHCFGAMMVLIKEGNPNMAMRMAAAFGKIDLSELKDDNNVIVDSGKEFIENSF